MEADAPIGMFTGFLASSPAAVEAHTRDPEIQVTKVHFERACLDPERKVFCRPGRRARR
jgi:hypothetical protein